MDAIRKVGITEQTDHRSRKPSSRWTKGLSCTNNQTGPLNGADYMVDEKQRFILYMCFETDQEHDACRALVIRSDQAAIEEWKKEKRDDGSSNDKSAPDAEEIESEASEEENEEQPQHPSDELSELMSRFRETMSSYRHLVRFGMIIMPVVRSSFINTEMYKNAGKHLEIVNEERNFRTYGVTARSISGGEYTNSPFT